MKTLSTKDVEKLKEQLETTQAKADKFLKNVFTEDVWYGITATAAQSEFESKVNPTIEDSISRIELLRIKIEAANRALEKYQNLKAAEDEYNSACSDGEAHPILKAKVNSARNEYNYAVNMI